MLLCVLYIWSILLMQLLSLYLEDAESIKQYYDAEVPGEKGFHEIYNKVTPKLYKTYKAYVRLSDAHCYAI